MIRAISIAALALAGAVSVPAAAQNIVTNGDFETGTIAGWTTNTSIAYPWGATNNAPIAGAYSANTGCVGAPCTDQSNLGTAQYLYQDLATVAGASYDLSFAFEAVGDPSELKVLFGNSVVADLIDEPANVISTYTYSGLIATSAVTRLTVLGRQDPGYDRLDSISVTPSLSSAVPEPATWALMILGFGGAGLATRRHKARVVAKLAA